MKTIAVALILMFSEVLLARSPMQVPNAAKPSDEERARVSVQAPVAARTQMKAADNSELSKLVRAQTEAINALSERVKTLEERVKRLESKR